MPQISVVIITYNEEQNIARCLQSVGDIADEILVVDSYSTDRTEEICRNYGVRFVRHAFEGYIEQKNWATQQASYNHILFLDADEALSEELKKSIKAVKQHWTHDGYTFNRLTNFCGRWIRHTSWYPSKKLRLYDRRKGQWGGINPHDRFEMNEGATVKHLEGDLLHYSYYTIEQQLKQINNFSEIISYSYFQQGKCPHVLWHVIFHPLWRFVRDYFIKLGFLDGFYGFVISVNGAYEVYLKYLKIYHRLRKEKQKPPYRLCFLLSSETMNLRNEKFMWYVERLKKQGVALSIVASRGSEIIKRAQKERIEYFNLKLKKNNIIGRIFSAVRFVRYLKLYRVGSVVVNDMDYLPFVEFCCRMAGISPVIVYNAEQSHKEVALNHYYYRQMRDELIMDSDVKFYTYLINHYKLVTPEKADAETSFFEKSEKEIFYRLKGQP